MWATRILIKNVILENFQESLLGNKEEEEEDDDDELLRR